MIEVGANDAPSSIPNTGTWFGGSLNTTSKCFDVLIAGKCEVNPSTYQLGFNITGAEQIPDFFTINSAGEIVFAESKVVCTIEKPRGHYEKDRIVIRLKKVATEEEKFKDYVCLGIRENGVIVDRLYDGNPNYYINTETMSKVELVPLISKAKMSEGYQEVGSGTKISATTIPFPTSGVFNFSAVYRIKIGNPIEWERHTTNLQEIKSGNGWYNVGRIGFGPMNGEENQFVVINKDNGQLATSSDCITWKDAGNIYGDGETAGLWETGLVYGNKTWCTVNRTTGEIMYLADGADKWELSESKVTKDAFCLIFANGIFMIVSDSGIVYTSNNAKKWDNIGKVSVGNSYMRVLGYGNGKWLCGNHTGSVLSISEDGRQWTQISSNLNSLGSLVQGGDYVSGYFYVIGDAGDVIRSSDGKFWTKVAAACNNDIHYNITSLGNELYMINRAGSCCHIGTLDPNDRVE